MADPDKVEMTKADFEAAIVATAKTALEAKLKELGLDKVDAKFAKFPAAFAGIGEDELAKMDKKERVVKFIRAVFHKDIGTLASMKAMAEGTGSAGGYVVPEEWAADIARIAGDYGLVRRFARRIPMGRDKLNYPTLTSGVSVTWPGENTAGSSSQPVLGSVQLNSATAVGLTVLSNELLADANVNLSDYLAQLFGEALAQEEDSQGLVGTGSPFTGILGNANVNIITMANGDNAFADVDLDYLADMTAAVQSNALRGASFIMHRSIWNLIRKEKAASGAIYQSASGTGGAPSANAIPGGLTAIGEVWGYPVYASDVMPDTGDTGSGVKFVAFGNLNNLFFGDRQSMTLDVSDSATIDAVNTFAANQSALRVTERIALAVGLPAGFAVLKTATTS